MTGYQIVLFTNERNALCMCCLICYVPTRATLNHVKTSYPSESTMATSQTELIMGIYQSSACTCQSIPITGTSTVILHCFTILLQIAMGSRVLHIMNTLAHVLCA